MGFPSGRLRCRRERSFLWDGVFFSLVSKKRTKRKRRTPGVRSVEGRGACGAQKRPTFRLRMTTRRGKGLPVLCGQDRIVIADHKNGDAQKITPHSTGQAPGGSDEIFFEQSASPLCRALVNGKNMIGEQSGAGTACSFASFLGRPRKEGTSPAVHRPYLW